MVEMWQRDFGLTEGNQKEWYALRDPMQHVWNMREGLPMLIVTSDDDDRVDPIEGILFYDRTVEAFYEAEIMQRHGEDHCLHKNPDRMKLIVDWLSKEED